jgi:glutamate--cysteine ligase
VEEWTFHLSTLFPEVRAKEFFELRSADTIAVEFLPAPIVFVTGLVYDSEAARLARSILPVPTRTMLDRADRYGLEDADLRDLAGRLSAIAVDGARRLGDSYISPTHLSEAREYFETRLRDS